MNKITWIIFSVFTVGLLATLVILSKTPELNLDKVDAYAIQVASKYNGNIADHIYGNVNSTVTLIEYGDFQCTACAYWHNQTTKKLVEDYKNQIRYVFRNFPLGSSHPNGKAAAAVAEAAGLQGKYWEMYNKLYETQDTWTDLSGNERTDFFTEYAKDLKLDITKFKSDIESESVSDKISFDYSLGKKCEITGTPAIFLNGEKVEPDTLEESVKTELKKAGIAEPTIN